MSKGLENLVNTNPVTPDYPWKDIKDDTGAGDGTPLDRISHADYHQTFRKLLSLAGITPNNLPDNVTNGYQYVEAFDKLYKKFNFVNNTTTGITLTSNDLGKLISTSSNVTTSIHTLPSHLTLQNGSSFNFVNNGSVGCAVVPFLGSFIFFNGAFLSGISLSYIGNFVELVLDKATNIWFVSNYNTSDTNTYSFVNITPLANFIVLTPYINASNLFQFKTDLKNNEVVFRGFVRNTNTGASVNVMTLPVGSRPAYDKAFILWASGAPAGQVNNVECIIFTNGNVNVYTSGLANNTVVSFDNVRFSLDA